MKQKNPTNHIYEKNLQALRKRYPDIAKKIESAPVTENYEVCGTGKKRYVNIYSRKHKMYFYEPEDPLKDVAEQLNLLKLKNTKIAVFLGFGLGYELDYFARNLASKLGTVKILVIEKDVELFKTALNMFNYVPMMNDNNIQLVVGEKVEDLFPIFEQFFRDKGTLIYLKAMKPVYHISSFKLHKDYYMNALRILRESGIYSLRFYGNDPYDSLIGVENMLGNLNEIVSNPGINLLYNRFKGKPAVVVATGPSLNKNKHLLKGLEDKAVIIAADASLRVLLDMEVKPHLVTSLERVAPTVKLLEEFRKEQVEDVYLAACPVVLPEVYEVYPGPRIIVYRNFDHFKWLGIDRGILEIKHSAGNMAFKVAEALGCSPIILIGQDLAYSRDGKTHARGALYGEEQNVNLGEKLEVMGNDGQPILTSLTWNEFRKAYEVDIAHYNGICINSTEGGAYINGTVVMDFQEAINRYINKSFNPLAIIKESINGFCADSISKDAEELKIKINSTIKDLKQMMELGRNAFEKIQEHENTLKSIIDKGEIPEGFNLDDVYDEIIGYQQRIIKIQPTMQLFLMHIIQPFHIKFHVDLQEVPDLYDNDVQIKSALVLQYAKWFAVIHDIIDICVNSLNNAEFKVNRLASVSSTEKNECFSKEIYLN